MFPTLLPLIQRTTRDFLITLKTVALQKEEPNRLHWSLGFISSTYLITNNRVEELLRNVEKMAYGIQQQQQQQQIGRFLYIFFRLVDTHYKTKDLSNKL